LGGSSTSISKTKYRPCCCCGVVSAQPRYVVFKEVYSNIFKANEKTTSGVFCSRCAAKTAFTASFKTWAFGWWSLSGAYVTVKTLKYNFFGGEKPKNKNFELLMQQAKAFLADGKPDFAKASAKQARKFGTSNKERKQVQNFLTALNKCKIKRLKDSWKKFGFSFYLQLVPFAVLLTAVLFAVIDVNKLKSFLPEKEPSISIDGFTEEYSVFELPFSAKETPYHTVKDKTDIYYGPNIKYDIMTIVEKNAVVHVTGIIPQSLWVRVMTSDGQVGFVKHRLIKKKREE
ncbi:MAG: SH3 domain-containing protein, partial [Alphaproteobacteria bacterium]|nr:SH3 domain-containing protein [Alphaproteobacteria bacterium]